MLTTLGSLAVLVLVWTASANAVVIYDNGAAPVDNGAHSDPDAFNTGRVVADDFSLLQNRNTITGVHWMGLYKFSNTPLATDSFTIKICRDAGGVPDACLASTSFPPHTTMVITSLVRTFVTTSGGFDIFSYSATVDPVTLPPGNVFWLAIVNDTFADTDDDWVWSAKDGAGNAVIQHDADDPSDTWHQSTLGMNFQLTGGLALTANRDSYMKQGFPNKNGGAETELVVRYQGPNRALVAFDFTGVIFTGLTQATLFLTVSSNGGLWGPGRTVGAYRVTANWTEGNGTFSPTGTGAGVTWNCATDTNISNVATNCTATWSGGAFVAVPTNTVTITNTTAGTVAWNVTFDVFSTVMPTDGWLLKKDNETLTGRINFSSREGPNPPQLVLE
jgi:hypothetical protein